MTAPMDVKALLALGEKATAALGNVDDSECRCDRYYRMRGRKDPDCNCDTADSIADLRALIDAIRSPEFAALVADGERWRFLHPRNDKFNTCVDEAIRERAARSGKGEGK